MHDAVAATTNLVEPLGTPEFFDSLYRECQSILNNDQCNIFHFNTKTVPTCLFTNAADANMRRITRQCVREYIDRGYRKDPTIMAAASAMSQNNSMFMRHLRAIDVFDRGYRRTFYSFAEVSQKISLVSRSQSGIYYINLYRNSEQNGFSALEVAQISQVSGLLCQMVAKHHSLTALESTIARIDTMATDRYERLLRVIRQSLLADEAGLTEREAGICAAVACGMTSEGIARENGISINTVATHRKRAYSKLRISSQAELFARFYHKVGRHALAEVLDTTG